MDALVAAPPITHSEANGTGIIDALQAVKLDPAVLEARVSMNSDGKKSSTAQAKEDLQQSPVLVPAASKLDSQKNMKIVEDEKSTEKVTEERSMSPRSINFEDMMNMHKAALLSLSPTQFTLLLEYTDTLRSQRLYNQKYLECAFCKNNGEPASWYSLHTLKDGRGRVRCPVLRGYRCRVCGATGDSAHTIKYCPLTDRGFWSSRIKW